MPILFQINVVANSGSTGRIAEGIAEAAMQDGWDCYTAYGRWGNQSKTSLYRIGGRWDVYFHYFKSRFFDMHGLASSAATKRLIQKIKTVNPDLIHLHNIHGYYINYQLLFNYLSKSNIPVVWTLHDCWAYTGHCVHYTSAKCNKWKYGCHDCICLLDYPSALCFDHSKKNYLLKKNAFTSVDNLKIVTVSEWLANEVKQSFLKKHSIRSIYNGIDVDVFKPVETLLNYQFDGKFVLLGVATKWNKRKGLLDFLELSKKLLPDEMIILVGLDHNQISKLPDNIIGIKKTEEVSELVALYSRADLYVNFSVEETFGLTTVESMACGTPSLVYNSTACPEIVTEDVGFVVEPHDIDGVLNVMRGLKLTGKQSYSEKCRNYIQTRYKKEDKYKEYIALYNELL